MSLPTATGVPARTPATGATPAGTGRRPGTATVLRWELAKLAAQARSRFLLLGCLIAPPIIVAVFKGQQPPSDTIYGRHIHVSGYAVPLLVLAFAAQWVFPLLASLVAGDIFANEDQHGTWKTILTRSVGRSQIFWAKTLTAIAFNLIASGTALKLVAASWATVLAPMLGFTALAILLSVTTRNPTVGVAAPVVAGFAMQLLSSVGGLNLARRLLLTTPFEAWHGLLTQHRFYGPLTTGIAVSAGWTVVCLTAAYISLRRRDITGG
jgi:ABC-2 type transport system permease protein